MNEIFEFFSSHYPLRTEQRFFRCDKVFDSNKKLTSLVKNKTKRHLSNVNCRLLKSAVTAENATLFRTILTVSTRK